MRGRLVLLGVIVALVLLVVFVGRGVLDDANRELEAIDRSGPATAPQDLRTASTPADPGARLPGRAAPDGTETVVARDVEAGREDLEIELP